MGVGQSPELGVGGRAFQRLGRGIVRHPTYPILFWVVLLLASLPLLAHLGSSTQNSASNVPSSAPSSVASAELARLFPNSSTPSSSLLTFTSANITDPQGQAAVLAVTWGLQNDTKLRDIGAISSLYSAYQQYLEGETELALGAIGPALGGTPGIEGATNASASLFWGPPSAYFSVWENLVTSHPSTAPSSWNYPAYANVSASFASSAASSEVLGVFYSGLPGGAPGFNSSVPANGTGDCAALYNSFVSGPSGGSLGCADRTARATGSGILPALAPNVSARAVGNGVLTQLGLLNFSSLQGQRNASAAALSIESGLPARWLGTVWTEFPSGSSTLGGLAAWTSKVSDGPVLSYPLPIPPGIRSNFLSPDGRMTIVVVAYSVDDSTTTSSGDEPIFDDVAEINRVAPLALNSVDPHHAVLFEQTGPAALDADESSVLTASLAIVLPLTIGLLVAITILYFRSPVAAAVSFGSIGLALGLGLGGFVLLASIFGKFDQTTITLENTFVLGVGTDYSIFLVARYREELRKGAPSHEAVVTSVTWAGQSIATSGGTAILATLALAFSGVGLLSQWGETLSVAVLITVLVALTMVPALLTLLGPRVFWPQVGERARRAAELSEERRKTENTYFFRAARLSQRRPKTIIALVLLASVPLVYVALVSPLGYNFYQQLPSNAPATEGLSNYGQHFGPGAAFPMDMLVTFQAPLLAHGAPNVTEFADLASLTALVNGTSGVASVSSPVGPYGAPLSAWIGYATAPPAEQQELSGALSNFVGIDGRTVVLDIVPSAPGLSSEAVTLLDHLKDKVGSFASSHADVASVAYGGGASVTSDLASQTALATERMVLAVSIGLLIVLFVVLRSWLIPPMAVATIGLSIGWAWGATQLLFVKLLNLSLFFFVPTVLFLLILGLGIDYNIFLLTRVREERLRGHGSREAVIQAVASTGGIISAAAIILAGAFASLAAGDFVLLQAIGFSVAAAVILDATVVRTYLVPASLQLLGDRVWQLRGGSKPPTADGSSTAPEASRPTPTSGN
jgi:RND superfamily putative drug exporter